ncbi:MAG: PepSY-like domain-containing protein [Parafilimonas sp.]
MKHLFLLLLSVAVFIDVEAQKCKAKDVPSSVMDAFHKDYPNEKKCYWGKDSINYEVAFFNGKAPISVTYDAAGKKLSTEAQMPVEDLPKNITEYVQKNYPGEIFQNVVQITDGEGIISYEVQVKDMALEFDAKGNYLESLKCNE